jgi:hypothetical protein
VFDLDASTHPENAMRYATARSVSAELIKRERLGSNMEQLSLHSAFHPEAWRDLYVMLGGSIAALTGLLFVAFSLHLAEIRKTPHFRVRAFGNTFELVGQLVNCALVLAPQPVMWLGIELLLFNTFLFFVVQVRFHLTWARAHARIELLRSSLGAVGGLLGVLGGASLMVHFGGGLYVCALGTLIMIWVVIWNAFSMMIATYADDAPI